MIQRTAIFFLLLWPLGLTACHDATPPSAAAPTKSAVDVVRDDLAHWMSFAAAEQSESASLQQELKRPIADLQALGLRHVQVLRTLYSSRAHRPAWIDLTGSTTSALNPHGEVLFETILDAGRTHGLDPSDLRESTLLELARAIEPAAQPFEDVRLEAAELAQLGAWGARHPDATATDVARALADRTGPAPRLAEMIHERAAALGGESRGRVRLDLHLSDALVEYGMQMRWANDAWTRDVAWPDHLTAPAADTRLGWDELRAERRDLVARQTLAPLFAEPARVGAVLAELPPPFEQYTRLTTALTQYRAFVDAGGWQPLPENLGELKVGDDHPGVSALKDRLAAEGYWHGDRSPKFGPSLADALREYQRTHQLWEKGTLSRETRASLNVPAAKRLAQIRVSLDRWRESSIGPDTHYVFVNVPDFHVEAWKDGVRDLRIKAVVGSTTHERDPETGAFAYVHATPSVRSRIEHVVLNPYWWVPADIVRNEIEPELARNPWYLQENDYEWAEDDRGEAALRQRPGPKNALGKVKLNFPNDHQIYMHDTPEKQLFRWPARAFSHGCIRLERPMELARYLLEQSGQWDEGSVNAALEAGKEQWLTLKNPLPVHVEYYVVRVDDRGRVNFLSDLYRRDLHRMRAALATGEVGAQTSPVRTLD